MAPYKNLPVIVLSSRPLSIPASLKNTVRPTSKSPTALLDELATDGKNTSMSTAAKHSNQSFLNENLIDEVTLTLIPVAICEGISLFSNLNHDVVLIHKQTKTFDFGYVQVTYQVKR